MISLITLTIQKTKKTTMKLIISTKITESKIICHSRNVFLKIGEVLLKITLKRKEKRRLLIRIWVTIKMLKKPPK